MSDHFDGRRFFNPNGKKARSLGDVLLWKLRSRAEPWPRDVMGPVAQAKPPLTAKQGELRATFVNHATVLLQVDGCNILTDPIWSKRASPVHWAGPKRRQEPGVRFDDLPPIHLVLLSHNHYDHLDMPSVRRLAGKHHPAFVAPLGVAKLLRSKGIDCAELDWWHHTQAAGIDVTCVPAQHFSARGLTDRNATLWCGYYLQTPLGRVYFAADTGFGEHFEAIQNRCGPPRLAFLPIGAYKPRWFMSPIHMGPDEAVRAHKILGAELSVAIHFGTFQLADDGPRTPVLELETAFKAESLKGRFIALRNGEHITLRDG